MMLPKWLPTTKSMPQKLYTPKIFQMKHKNRKSHNCSSCNSILLRKKKEQKMYTKTKHEFHIRYVSIDPYYYHNNNISLYMNYCGMNVNILHNTSLWGWLKNQKSCFSLVTDLIFDVFSFFQRWSFDLFA